jgi:hypothetical protein
LRIFSVSFHVTSTFDQIFCTHQILERKWEYNETVYHLDFKKISIRREILYNVLIEWGYPSNNLSRIKCV